MTILRQLSTYRSKLCEVSGDVSKLSKASSGPLSLESQELSPKRYELATVDRTVCQENELGLTGELTYRL